ncbi:MAG: HAD-IA family hydrolase [Chloroflexi bacterium]|nr:HAD-IA family hydrolase [Chloroflexota bacterium]
MSPSPNGLRAYLFDLDGTLRFNQPSGYQTFIQYGRDLGLDFTPEAVRSAERWQHQFWADRSTVDRLFAEMGEAGGWLEISRRQLVLLGATGPIDDYAEAIQRRFLSEYQSVSVLGSDVIDTLAALRDRGYIVGLVSNRDEALDSIAEQHGMADLFDFTLSAGEAQSWKPEPAIFHRALEMAGVPAHSTAHVGDNYYADVVGAQNAGLVPILFDPTGLFPDAACRIIASVGELLEP